MTGRTRTAVQPARVTLNSPAGRVGSTAGREGASHKTRGSGSDLRLDCAAGCKGWWSVNLPAKMASHSAVTGARGFGALGALGVHGGQGGQRAGAGACC